MKQILGLILIVAVGWYLLKRFILNQPNAYRNYMQQYESLREIGQIKQDLAQRNEFPIQTYGERPLQDIDLNPWYSGSQNAPGDLTLFPKSFPNPFDLAISYLD